MYIFTIFQLLNSSASSVTLTPFDQGGSGIYECEVMGEAPRFGSVTSQKDMLVVGKSKRLNIADMRKILAELLRVPLTLRGTTF